MASKAEYLKKYLSGPSSEPNEEKRKKKRKAKKTKNVTVHDDDLDWKKLAPKIDEYDDDDPEEAPIVIDITGDDPETNFKWKAVQPASPVNLSVVKVEKTTPSPPPSPSGSPSNNVTLKIRKKKRKERADTPDFSPPRRKRPQTQSDDLSPPRKKKSKSPTDVSPPRKKTKPPTRVPDSRSNFRSRGAKTTPPPRTKKQSISSDTSPPRKSTQLSTTPPRSRLDSSQSDLSLPRHSPPPMRRVLGSKKAGLQSGDTAQEEVLRANAERERFIRSLDPLVSGRYASTVYRNKEGKKIDPNVPENPPTEEEKRKKEEDDLQFAQWGRGVAQVQSAQDKVEDEIYEMSKPLARYRDDEDLEKLLKEREREGDPMLKFLTKTKKKKSRKGESKDADPRSNRPTYQGSWPQNRFGIPPGYRWDGVDRSNGYESKRYLLKADKESIKEFAYKWSVEDM